MLGGNSSSEVRVWVSGAEGRDQRETGILEELMMENQYRNPMKSYSIWDHLLYDAARNTEGLTVLLNCSCLKCRMRENRLTSVTGWQTTTQKYHTVRAKVFADCSGDSILAPLTNAEFRVGRESCEETGEYIAPLKADRKTMGISCLLQAVEGDEEIPFTPCCDCMNVDGVLYGDRQPDLNKITENFWYLELGGNGDSIGNCESVRDSLLDLNRSVWNYIKNRSDKMDAYRNWYVDWMGMLPGKRESRRYIGDYVLTQMDIDSGGVFEDEIAYGGWPMDLHPPDGFDADESPNVFHTVNGIYGIPYRCMYSKNIENLFFAGRNISATHVALGSTRVMGTCALLGQAIGTAAAIAVQKKLSPRLVGEREIDALQQRLLWDDVYLPHIRRRVPALSLAAGLTADGENGEALRDGVDRPVAEDSHAWSCTVGDTATYSFAEAQYVGEVRLVWDSDLNRENLTDAECELKRNMFHNRSSRIEKVGMPRTMVKAYRITAVTEDGTPSVIAESTDNHRRLCIHPAGCKAKRITLEILETWGNASVNVFAFEVRG